MSGTPAPEREVVLHVTVGPRALLAALLVVVLLGTVVGLASRRDGHRRAARAVTSAAESPAQAAGERALALVRFDWQQLGYRIRFAERRQDVRAQTDPAHRTITVFVTPSDVPHRLAHDIAHELGHAYDATYLSTQQRLAYLAARSRNGTNWWPGLRSADYTGNAVTDYGSGAGDFAEVFALCHSPSPEFRSTLAARPPDPCALIPVH